MAAAQSSRGLHLTLHHFPQCAVDASLIPLAVLLEPGKHIGIKPQRDRLLQRTIKSQDPVHSRSRLARSRIVGVRHDADWRAALFVGSMFLLGGFSRPRSGLSTVFCNSMIARHFSHFCRYKIVLQNVPAGTLFAFLHSCSAGQIFRNNFFGGRLDRLNVIVHEGKCFLRHRILPHRRERLTM